MNAAGHDHSWWSRTVRPAARLGLKGPDAPGLLQRAGITIPAHANGITRSPGSALAGLSRCLRLGSTEFLLEQDEAVDAVHAIHQHAQRADQRAWPVIRADFTALIGGTEAFTHLSRLASFDFESWLAAEAQAAAATAASPAPAASGAVVMTLLADISITLAIESADAAAPQLRLWADASFAGYLQQTLQSLCPSPPSLIPGVHA